MLKIKKRISLFLILFLLVQMIPTNINAKENNKGQGNEKKTEEKSKVKKKKTGKITKEKTEERTENSKKFEKDDGSFEVAQYADNIHYLKDGKLLDIDNSLTEIKDKDGNAYLENKENDFKVKISKDVTSKKLIELEKDKYNISWNIDKVNKSEAAIDNIDENKLKDEIEKSVDDKVNNDKELSLQSATDKEEAKAILTENEETKTLEKVNSSVDFTNVFENTDLQYVIKGSKVKENLILNKKTDNISYNFNINVKNLNAVLQEDKSIIFYDSEDNAKEVFKIESPIMYDKSGEASDKINVSLNQTKDGYVLEIIPDKEWLNSSDRVYPITIDPSMETSSDVNAIHDTFVASNDTHNKWNNEYIRVGKTPSIGTTRTYIKFDLPKLSTGDMITGAQLNLIFWADESSASGSQINVHNVNTDYKIGELTWANKAGYDSQIEALSVINSNVSQRISWNITGIVKRWFKSGNNYGLMLESDNSTGHSTFLASDMSSDYSEARPYVSFFFVNNSGLEDYWTYHSQSVGRAGTSYSNDYNGNLVFIHNDFSINGNRMPISINHVYNSNDRYNVDNQYGFGWRLNLSQKVARELINGKGHYTYIDEDGTKHYFEDKPGTEMSDDLNLGLKLKIETYDKSCTITDKKGNKLNFHPGVGDLNYIKDANGNTMNFGYSTASCGNGVRTLTKIADGAGRYIDIGYTPVGGLDTIKDMEGRITYYNYDGIGKLTSITYPDGKISKYIYDENRNLKSVINHDGYKISYDYYPIAPYRIKNISEYNINELLGGSLGISYGNNSTTFTDFKGRKDTYQFNDIGKTVCIKDSYGNAEYYEYGDATNATKLTNKSKLQKTIVNLLTNHDLETNDVWEPGSDAGTGTGGYSTETSYLGSRSLKLSKSDNVSRQFASQWLTLEKGKTYTFSAYVKTVNISNTNNNGQGATIDAYYDPTGSSLAPTYKCSKSKVVNGTTDWQRLESTFTIPIDAVSASVCIILNLEKETGTAYFDSMQLEEGSIANRYNLLDNGHLSEARAVGGIPSKWSTNGTSGSISLIPVNDSDHPSNLDSSVYGVSGEYGVEKRLGQSAYVGGKAGDIYSIGGWGKGYSVPSGVFGMQAAIITPNGVQWENFSFNKDSNDWQYISGRFITKSDYLRIDVYFLYKDNANTAYFDGAQLYKEEFGQSYQYDSKGNIASTASIAKQNSDFQYNSKNDLIQAVDPKGSAFNYTYDDKHNLKTALSSENVNYSFNYGTNGYGNLESVQIGNSTKYIKSSATYTENGNYLDTIKDSSGNTVKYVYNPARGTLDNVTDAKKTITKNTYNIKTDSLESTSKTVDNKLVKNSYEYENDKLKSITHNGFSYTFGYDILPNNDLKKDTIRDTVAVANQNLITNDYERKTGLLGTSTYGNGHVVKNTYDDLDRIKSKDLGGNVFDYEYDASGNLGYKKDSINGVNYRYIYDTSNRLVSTKESNGNSLNYQYDLNNNISSVFDKVNDKGYITNYGYDKDNKPTEISYNRSNNNMEIFTLNGSGNGTKGTNQITSSITTGITATATINNVTSEGYDVVVTVSSAQGGVKQVSAPTWTTINGQDDLTWIAATSVSGDTYTYRINRSEHKGEYGGYNTHVYVYDKVGNSKCIPLVTKLVSTPLAVTAEIKDVDSNGYNVVATVTSAPSGVNRVAFPTWTTNNGQDDLAWPTATSVSGNTYTYHVNRSDHKGEYGVYNTHVYLYDNLGNVKAVVLSTTLASANLSVSAEIANVTSTGYDVIAKVIPGAYPISKVSFPTWTTCIGQDDLTWLTATSVSGNTYTYHVNRIDHKGEFGGYNTHVYVYDQSGKSAVATSSTTLYASVNGIDMAKDIKEINEIKLSKTVMAANGLTQALYNLGLSKNAGTMSTMVKIDTIGKMRFILASQGSKDEGLYLYIGSDDKLKVAVRNNAGNMVDVVTSTDKIKEKQWYFTAISWELDKGTTLKITMCVDGVTYTGSTTDFKDFSGANTSLGASVTGNLSLKGLMEQFSYNSKTMSSAEMQNTNKEANNTTINYKYDSLGRLENQVTSTGGATNKVIYSYKDGVDGVGSTTPKINTLDNNGKKIEYEYDENGNIKKITENSKIIEYIYNELNELIRENNEVLNKTMVYNYDAGGNITSKVQYPYTTTKGLGAPSTPTPINYVYDVNWKDKLKSYNGKTITYSPEGTDIGNPLDDGTYKYEWEAGRQLKKISVKGTLTEYKYKYNDSGIRTQKIVNGVTTNYHLEGDKVTYESNGTDKMYYTYDSSGNLVSMNLNGVEYYYIRNVQSDIIGLFDKAGTQVVSYVYDSWGKLEATTGSLASTVGTKNPYRYKGYRYDTETGLYYLQSRYYNPDWGRMLNADDPGVVTATLGELTDKNLFAYCDNNPIMRVDEDGQMWETFIDIANLGYSAFNMIKNPSWGNFGYLAWDAGATLVPFVPGSYTAKAFKVAGKASSSVKSTTKVASSIPKNMSPIGSARNGAFNAAKQALGIPKTQQPVRILPNINKRKKVVPGRVYDFGNGKTIRDDVIGHSFPDGGGFGRHFNVEELHFFY